VLQKTLADVARRYPDDRVIARVIRGGPAEQLYANHPFFQSLKMARDGLLNNIL
jgi:hypothetical protein